MNITEFMDRLSAAYSLFTPEKAEVWTPVYAASLKQYEGPVLAQIFRDTLRDFKATSAKAWPAPLDFQRSAPASHPNLGKEGPKLDFRARGDRCRNLMAEWRREQGHRAAGGRVEILRALEAMVEPLANLWAWSADPKPLLLSRAQVRLVQHRAISQERVKRHGPIPKNAKVWWSQIEEIAQEWEIETQWDDWASRKEPRLQAAE